MWAVLFSGLRFEHERNGSPVWVAGATRLACWVGRQGSVLNADEGRQAGSRKAGLNEFRT